MEIDENPSTPEHNLSLVAGNIVSNAVQATRHLFCPFCADFFLFEFTLKDHLKKAHTKELRKQHTKDVNFETANDSLLIDEDDAKENCSCKFCGAIFKYAGLLPKHIADHHDPMCLNLWQQQNERDGDLPFGSRTSDPTILYARCSPGLSDLFDKFSTKETVSETPSLQRTSTPLKSILKKSTNKSAMKIICSPSSAGIRRAKNTTLVRRSSSVRRELRFDFNDENEMPVSDVPDAVAGDEKMPNNVKNTSSTDDKKRNKDPKSRKRSLVRKLFLGQCASTPQKKTQNKMVTSTPINFMDDSCDSISLMSPNDKMNSRDWKAIRQRTKPLYSYLERYQCAHCRRTWESNADLLTHLNEKHKKVRRWFLADYRCGACSAKFFSNRFLVRHCHMHHTPLKRCR